MTRLQISNTLSINKRIFIIILALTCLSITCFSQVHPIFSQPPPVSPHVTLGVNKGDSHVMQLKKITTQWNGTIRNYYEVDENGTTYHATAGTSITFIILAISEVDVYVQWEYNYKTIENVTFKDVARYSFIRTEKRFGLGTIGVISDYFFSFLITTNKTLIRENLEQLKSQEAVEVFDFKIEGERLSIFIQDNWTYRPNITNELEAEWDLTTGWLLYHHLRTYNATDVFFETELMNFGSINSQEKTQMGIDIPWNGAGILAGFLAFVPIVLSKSRKHKNTQ